MKPDKEHIRHCLLFSPKEVLLMHRIICETYRENVIIIRMCANWLNRFKNGNFDIRHKKFWMPCNYGR